MDGAVMTYVRDNNLSAFITRLARDPERDEIVRRVLEQAERERTQDGPQEAVMNDNPQAHMRAAAASAHHDYVPPAGEYKDDTLTVQELDDFREKVATLHDLPHQDFDRRQLHQIILGQRIDPDEPIATSPLERIAEALERLAAAFEQPQDHTEHPPVFGTHIMRADGSREDFTRTDLANGMVAFERTVVADDGTVLHHDGPVEVQRGDTVTWPPFQVSWT